MRNLSIILFVLFSYFVGAQKGSILGKRYYRSGQIKEIAYNRGVDTIELIKYHENGLINDSVWIKLDGKKQILFGNGRRYYPSGVLRLNTFFGNTPKQNINYYYYDNGQLRFFAKNPGIRQFYNKKGKLVRQFDLNKNDQIFVSRKNRIGKHLEKTNYPQRIRSKKAELTNGMITQTINKGKLISLALQSDTTPIEHCYIEGFSADSIYFSKFDYDISKNRKALKFDSTFCLSIRQIKTIFYSKHNTYKRYFGGMVASVTGSELIVLPIVLGAFANPDLSFYLPLVAISSAIAIPFIYWSKYLYKTMIPKRYDLDKWTIKPKL